MTTPSSENHVVAELRGRVGCITLNRPQALNALSLGMIRSITQVLLDWRDDHHVLAVVVRGMSKAGPFGAFCAGGDIRFFHQAALNGNPELEDFFTEEYALNHLIHTYAKPYIALMDGIVMGGGMGISQGASLRIVTERSKMAMPETGIGLFPDVGGGYFLSRCAGRLGEYLALTGLVLDGRAAMAVGFADGFIDSGRLAGLWNSLAQTPFENGASVERWCASHLSTSTLPVPWPVLEVNRVFGLNNVPQIMEALAATDSEWAHATLANLHKRSPLMLHVVLEQIRRARGMGLAEDLRMERNMVRRCFQLRPGSASETVEGIRALAVDKDHQPRWNPARVEDVTPDLVAPFFESPWPAHAHPLRAIG
ncbi:MAG: enoyl-CoA hydratase/isomerase family protein [Hydrogenophaga sp.]|uniref:enoyl-CoA hydratase/isomerase family protein n=1 Tax=Hydrogenophaga sp. TaxID=1904254 RepID=UPI00276FFD86|nr:enoyl-CoA hydratase/isomerase family protein [Hydrogenophaga sp.]MDP2418046.1 enoyl-CoA hydratase/isomerase family protein [Hydrogenophaga sp.]MDZ4188733.1 enoyl-CoA hydratase/isomerase family protein [Hydrogenophaga sp.]